MAEPGYAKKTPKKTREEETALFNPLLEGEEGAATCDEPLKLALTSR